MKLCSISPIFELAVILADTLQMQTEYDKTETSYFTSSDNPSNFWTKNWFSLNGLDTEIENLLKTYNAVGLSIAVVENSKTIYSKGFGFRDLENKLPVTANSIFPIGSITKSFTASLLGILENQNQLSLKDKPSLYIPKLQFYNDKMDNLITI